MFANFLSVKTVQKATFHVIVALMRYQEITNFKENTNTANWKEEEKKENLMRNYK